MPIWFWMALAGAFLVGAGIGIWWATLMLAREHLEQERRLTEEIARLTARTYTAQVHRVGDVVAFRERVR